ncbi:MAG: hypothetical protein HND52_18140 [Ignavibacteriae bacterium]|nr:hypothetical protein [Ignavibacteriota bacterium]NOG99883.1 hypothetical protein [Ignavibacteriota bacterium]
MQEIAEKYVKLVLKVGQYDGDVVDAYHGPDEWKPAELSENEKVNFPKDQLNNEAQSLIKKLNAIDAASLTELEKMRRNFLLKHITAIDMKIKMISGEKFKFDEESKYLSDGVAPHYNKEHFEKILSKLDNLLPGKGNIGKRFEKFRSQFVIPTEKLDTIFTTAITECRKRTLKYIQLPEEENFVVEYVKDKPWGAYNWYKGNSFSVIQVNTDMPIYIDRAVDLASHEGYPGHHVFNALLEKNLLKEKNWIEYSIYPLFSPMSLIAEGSANYGIEVAFPGNERIEYEKEILFPLAGMDASKADKYYEILELESELAFARNDGSRKYLDGEISREELKKWLMKYNLYTPARADQAIAFAEKYRSYLINYNYGKKLSRDFVESKVGTEGSTAKRWEVFADLISKPYTPSDLK